MFVEHVLSDDAALRAQQLALDGLQAKLADGCHLNRQTLRTIQSAGFADYELVEEFTLPGSGSSRRKSRESPSTEARGSC